MTRKITHVVAFLACLLTLSIADARAGDYPRSATAASSALWDASNAIDGNAGTAWSSTYHSSGSGYEWIAFWFDTFHSTNYVRLTPRTYNGVNQCVPTSIDIYYSGTDASWHYLETVSLSENITQTGYTIVFPTVNANGFLFTTDSLRADAFGGYYFQLAEVNGGWQNRFFGWTPTSNSSPLIPIQYSGLQSGQARQYVGCDYELTSASCPTAGAISFISSGNVGQLYILGDEPDMVCTPAADVASAYHSFVQTILAYDPTARFSPPGFAQPNSSCNGLHFTDYATQFLQALETLESTPRIDEWRFHAFGYDYTGSPYNLTCSAGWQSDTWHTWIEAAASWSVANNAPMFLGSYGFPASSCDIVTPGWEQDMLDTVLNDPRIVGASWWSYDAVGSDNNLVQSGSLTAVGTLYQSYVTR